MREHLPKLIVVTLLLLVIGLPFLLRPTPTPAPAPGSPAPGSAFGNASGGGGGGASGGNLIIITPHNEQIRFEMAAGFNRWRAAQGLPPVRFDWRASGGTTDLRRGILSQFQAKANQGRLDEGIGADLFYGGGEYDHGKVAKGIEVGDGEAKKFETVAAVATLPDGLFEEVFTQPLIGGEPLYHKDRLWLGSALSSFGIVFNRDLLVMLDLPEPSTWSDLTDPRYENWLALADPGHSGSIAATFNTVLRRQGWEQGWATLRRVFANGRYFSSAASKVPVDVSSGEAAAGMCIDFYGRTQAGAVRAAGWSGDVEGKGMSRVGYTDPVVNGASMTATTADPITLLRGAPHRAVAEQFIAWTLSKEAQRLWQTKLGTPPPPPPPPEVGGPLRYELRRQPIRRDLYTPEEKKNWTDPEIDPFPTAVPIKPGMPDFFAMVTPVSQAMAIDVHDDLVEAWRAILRTPDGHADKAEMLRLFDAMPPELTLTWPDAELRRDWPTVLADKDHARFAEAAGVLKAFLAALSSRDDEQKLRDKLAWTLFFQDNYRRIASMGAGE